MIEWTPTEGERPHLKCLDALPVPGLRVVREGLNVATKDWVRIRDRAWWPHPASVAEVRVWTAAALVGWGLPELVDDALLCVSELVTNSVTHAVFPAGDGVTVRLWFWQFQALAVEVVDPDRDLPGMRASSLSTPSPAAVNDLPECHRGLATVRAFSDQLCWGPHEYGKSVWCRFDLEQRGLARPFPATGTTAETFLG